VNSNCFGVVFRGLLVVKGTNFFEVDFDVVIVESVVSELLFGVFVDEVFVEGEVEVEVNSVTVGVVVETLCVVCEVLFGVIVASIVMFETLCAVIFFGVVIFG